MKKFCKRRLKREFDKDFFRADVDQSGIVL